MRLLGRLLILLFILPALVGAELALWRGAERWFGDEPAALENGEIPAKLPKVG